MEESYSEGALLHLINIFVSSQNGKNIFEKITNYIKSSNNEPKQEIFEAIKYFVEEETNQIINNDLLGLKNTFIKIFIDLLRNEDYKKGNLEKNLLSSKIDPKIRKRMKITSLLCYANFSNPQYKIFFFMLNSQKFEKFKKLFKNLNFPFDKWEDFNNKIDEIKEENIDELINSDKLTDKNINDLMASLEDFLLNINPESSNPYDIIKTSDKKTKKKKKNEIKNEKENENDIILNPEQIQKTIEENKNEKVLLNQERRNRIFELISNNLKVDANEIEKININDFINNIDS